MSYSLSNTHNLAYTTAQLQRVVGFSDIYPDETPPNLESLLIGVPRESMIRFVQIFVISYENADYEKMLTFFSSDNNGIRNEFIQRFKKLNKTEEITYNFCPLQTPTELVKQVFAIPYSPKTLKKKGLEESLFKAILFANDLLTNFTHQTKTADTLEKVAEWMVVNSFSQKDINNFDHNTVFREVFTKSIDFFEYASTDAYFKPIYQEFLNKLQINHYKDYIFTFLGLFTITLQNEKAGTFIYDPLKDPDRLIKTSVLDYISIAIDDNISIDKNKDFIAFRDKPLIKLKDGTYEIFNIGFLLDRLFSSLYFDFKCIAKKLGVTRFENEYTESFMEKTLLNKYLRQINSYKRYFAMSGEDSVMLKQKRDDGEPDYYMRSKEGNIILFENKDILINADIKQSRDYNRVINEFKNKLLLKTYNNKGKIKNPKPEGIGQLVEQIKKIQNKKAFWDKEVSLESIIYPVLVLGDTKLLPDGITYLMQKWYEESCQHEKVNTSYTRPLIVLSVSTLLLYSQEFSEKGLEYYFEQYYNSKNQAMQLAKTYPNDLFLMCSNLSVSFTEYMQQVYPKDFLEVYYEYKKHLFSTGKFV